MVTRDWLAGKVDRSRLLEWHHLRRRVSCEKLSMDNIPDIVAGIWKVGHSSVCGA